MHRLAVVVLFVLCAHYTSTHVFDDILDETDDCSAFCDGKPHPAACSRGCRLYTIMGFLVYEDDLVYDETEANVTLNACFSSCLDAYRMANPRSNCRVGCSKQQETSAAIRKEEMELSSLHMLTPLSHVYNMYSSLVGNVERVMSVSWSVFVEDDNGRVNVVESPPQQKMLSSVQPRNEPEHLAVERRPETVGEASSSNDLLDCLSLRSGLPRWFLALSIFFSAMVMIWLCFATTVTAPEQHVKQRLGVKSDLEHLKLADLAEEELPMKVKLYPEDIHDMQMAPPLPIKITMEKV